MSGATIDSADARACRRLRKLPVTAIADAPPGVQVRLQGVVQRHEAELSSTLTRQACVYYAAKLDEKSGDSWRERVNDSKGVDFVLRDASGEAPVRVEGARWIVRIDHHSSSGSFDPADESQLEFLRRHDRSATNVLGFNRTLRYRERVLEIGCWVSVFAVRSPDSRKPVFAAGPREFLIIDEETPASARH